MKECAQNIKSIRKSEMTHSDISQFKRQVQSRCSTATRKEAIMVCCQVAKS